MTKAYDKLKGLLEELFQFDREDPPGSAGPTSLPSSLLFYRS